jgi:4-hydroxybenzoate polyprenyltransferase/phosphoserine phosphatase
MNKHMHMPAENPKQIPLVVDLDGTLTPTDTLVESIFCLLKINPLNLFSLLFWLRTGRAEFKQHIAQRVDFSPQNLPWREDLLDWLRLQRSAGRSLILATAAHEKIANSVALQFDLFDSVISTNGKDNLKGAAKLAAIQQRVGPRFAYAGDSKADLPIWRAAEAAILVGVSTTISREVHATVNVEKVFEPPGKRWLIWLRALRLHQWMKNLLLFVPLFTAFAFNDGAKLLAALLAFFSFSLAASATYLFNDLWDLDNDRQHPRKKYRPFACAGIPLFHGLVMAGALLILAMALALSVSVSFASMVGGYILLTTAYSWTLKQYVLIDVLMLALLYTFRVLAGSVATDVNVTFWLLAFSIFTFFGLALVKRCAELLSLQQEGKQNSQGRDYQTGDMIVLWPLGIGASLCSVVIFGLYIASPGAAVQYNNTNALWLSKYSKVF